MSKRALAIVAVALLLIAGGVAYWATALRPGTRSAHAVTVERRAELSSVVRATGKLDVTGRLIVPLTQAGTVRVVAVKVGDAVRAGDVLAAIDDTRQRQDVQAASDALDAAQYGLTNARARGDGDAGGRAAIVTAE